MVNPSGQRVRRTAASAARDAISTAARIHSAALLEDEQVERDSPSPSSGGGGGRRRTTLGKRVSYAEVPVDADDNGDDLVLGDEENDEGVDKDDQDVDMDDGTAIDLDETGSVSSGDATPTTTRTQRRTRAPAAGRGGKRRRGKAKMARSGSARETGTEDDQDHNDAANDGDDGEDAQQAAEEAGTPIGADAAEITQHKVKGVLYDVINDEIEMEEDPRGETKVDADGRLLGDRLYALSIDIARTLGFTDSSVMLRRLPMLVKVSMTPSEKEQAIEAGKVQSSMRLRSVTMIPVRNVYKYLGAKIVKDGRYVTDDYYEEAAREECAENGIEPNSLVPDRPFAVEQDTADRTIGGAYGAERSIGAPFYFPGGPTTHWGGAGWNPWHNAGQGNKRAKLHGQGFTRDNWMWKMAQEAKEREREIREARERRMVDFSGERLTVFSEQYAGDEQSAMKYGNNNTDAATTTNGTTNQQEAERRTAPLAQDLAGLFQQDDAFRQRYRQATNSQSGTFDASQLVGGVGDVGSVVVETRAETMARHGQKAIKLKPGVYRGMYEPHTNTPHVRQDLQPTAASMDKVALLPQVETKRSRFRWDPDHTFASTLTLRRIGASASAVYSVDYAFEASPQEDRDEVDQKERMVKEAVEWERQTQGL
ncbi:hypothetical protein QFC21_006967 [Naganishia friedmannii]|uniref:Uncharacterized protein n=1 Tax=Naganishia friedmannii TaxID=89922 RepID=A0ACC2UZQ5_9TREE|nr:hypothetical protein QFC21_006967 [Naganishia friedmannii]